MFPYSFFFPSMMDKAINRDVRCGFRYQRINKDLTDLQHIVLPLQVACGICKG
jgi:hypothetical protein